MEQLFFDLDGPILDVSQKYFAIYSHLVRELGGSPLEAIEYWQRKRNRVPELDTLRASGVNDNNVASFRNLRKTLIETPPFWHHDVVWPEVREAISGSPWKGKLILVTLRNNPIALREELLQLGIADWFESVLSTGGDAAGADRHMAKVHLVRECFDKIVPSGWFVGDTETDLRTGKVLNLKTAAVTFGIRSEALIRAEAPDMLFQTPSELASWIKTLPPPK